MQDFDSIPINQNTKIINGESMMQGNEAMIDKLNQQNEEEASLRNKKLKPYEQSE